MNYMELLDRAYSQLPEKVFKSDRFEIPRVESFIEGNRTFFVNFKSIATTLRRDESHIMKFLFKELGTPGYVEGSRLVLQSKVPNKLLQDRINKYVKEYVLCWECGKPDTHITTIQGVRTLVCEACGARRPVRQIR